MIKLLPKIQNHILCLNDVSGNICNSFDFDIFPPSENMVGGNLLGNHHHRYHRHFPNELVAQVQQEAEEKPRSRNWCRL